jgi:hypothetical protein
VAAEALDAERSSVGELASRCPGQDWAGSVGEHIAKAHACAGRSARPRGIMRGAVRSAMIKSAPCETRCREDQKKFSALRENQISTTASACLVCPG